MRHILLLLGLYLAFLNQANAYHDRSWNKQNNDRSTNASACNRATTSTTIEYNNVRALIHTGGDMWWDLVGTPKYEVPKGSGKTSLFAGAIWMGGTDINDQLKMAALRFRSGGVDYWTGPLIVNGMNQSTTSLEVCNAWDRHFVVSRQEVSEFRAYITAVLNGDGATLADQFSTYTIPEIILEWPAHGDDYNAPSSLGYDYYLAPFFDNDGNGDYNPESGGDYPYFDLDGIEKCGTSREDRVPRLYGDYTMYWIYNDKGNIHTETNGDAIGMEIRAQYFAFATADELNNMTFGNYALLNRSTYTLYNTYFGVWTDADLGDPEDDYVGCDVTRGLGYLYNGDDMDGTGNGNTYGAQPPAIGVDFFEGPYMDPWVYNGDTVDRPSAFILDEQGFPTDQITPGMLYTTDDDGVYNGSINGLNFGDSIGGNERWGMRRFIYFINGAGATGDPDAAQDYYNYLRGFWTDNRPLTFGGTGYTVGGGTATHFMFPGVTDPYLWGTEGIDPNYVTPDGWTEENEANDPDDKRFVQSAGPFTLEPGAVNDITVGMVWARATSGGPFASVKKVQEADDKAQRLFDVCFKMIDGPDAPDLKITELHKELIFQIYNVKNKSNNYLEYPEDYDATDPFIVCPPENTDCNSNYKFEGYQIFQVKDVSVTTADLDDPAFSRLVFQCDIKNDVSTIINYPTDAETGKISAQLMVSGNNTGIQHSFKLTEDAFATAEKALVPHKKYYYVAVAYAYNNYKTYDQNDGATLDGQKYQYLRGRKGASGSIKTYMAIPHMNTQLEGGSEINSAYGDELQITMVEGMGNGNNDLDLSSTTINRIMSGYPWKTNIVQYNAGKGPIKVKVVDPLNIKEDVYTLRFDSVQYSKALYERDNGLITDAQWYIYSSSQDSISIDTVIYQMVNDSLAVKLDNLYGTNVFEGIKNVLYEYNSIQNYNADTFKVDPLTVKDYKVYPENCYYSTKSIVYENDQIIFDLGISVQINQVPYPGPGTNVTTANYNTANGYITSEIVYSDPSQYWIKQVKDQDGESAYNWIRSGITDEDDSPYNSNQVNSSIFIDPNGNWTNIVDGLFAPYRVVSVDNISYPLVYQPGYYLNFDDAQDAKFDQYKRNSSIDFVITKDTTKWTRCPVVEMCEFDATGGTSDEVAGPSQGGAKKFRLRRAKSVYRNGKPVNPNALDSIDYYGYKFLPDSGMGWFPGYAIDVETGERLNIFFGEDSKWGSYNGADMLWNPHYKEYTDLYGITGGQSGELIFGGKHNIYVWGHSFAKPANGNTSNAKLESNSYDEGSLVYSLLRMSESSLVNSTNQKNYLRGVYDNVIWLARPMLRPQFSDYDNVSDPYGFIKSDVYIKIRMANPYRGKGAANSSGTLYNASSFLKDDSLSLNDNAPMFYVSTIGKGRKDNLSDVAKSALDYINVVPNPYYAYDSYELKQTQKLVKFTNLPENCTISIYNIGGSLVRRFEKSSPLTYLDWDLKNEYDIEIAGGVYIIHINVPGVGEKILKWFGVLRPIDLDNI
ncbi:MAG: hypothetical protein JXR60_06655 [Bacteroidales bacterium]|nr:hypothetical protein [Bacteroidales bacterium]